tara:strand:+ start:43 stop:717 length:675 start_codon:yes stop_codon:yes gene_type:complete
MVTARPHKKVLADLKASILDPALTSHFQCWFSPPGAVRALLGGEWQDDRLWSLSCAESALPGTSLATTELINDYTGVTERHAYRRQYDTTSSFTFYVDHNYKIINFFEKWIGYIVNDQNSSDINYSYRVNFPKSYQTSIYIKKFEKDYNRVLEYKFLKAYPISINTMPVNYDASQLLKCTVNFNFSRYLVDTQSLPNDAVLFGTNGDSLGVGANDLVGTTANVG